MEAPNPLIRDTAEWLVKVLQDEVPLADPAGMKGHFMVWLAGFRYLNVRQTKDGPDLLKRASYEALRYYEGQIHQSFHNWQDKAYLLGYLSQALLLACNCFERPMNDVPGDLLRSESLHQGYYSCLYEGVTAMIFGVGIKDLSYQPKTPFYKLSYPFLSPN